MWVRLVAEEGVSEVHPEPLREQGVQEPEMESEREEAASLALKMQAAKDKRIEINSKYHARTNWSNVYHRMQRGKDGEPDCQCGACLAEQGRIVQLAADGRWHWQDDGLSNEQVREQIRHWRGGRLAE
jgi:hypothetical protein